MWGELASHKRLFNPPSQFSRLGIQVSYYSFFPVLIMYIMCIVCLGYLSFFPTSAIASVLCTCISMYEVAAQRTRIAPESVIAGFTTEYLCRILTYDVCIPLASFPGHFLRGRKKRPGTICSRMRTIFRKISVKFSGFVSGRVSGISILRSILSVVCLLTKYTWRTEDGISFV